MSTQQKEAVSPQTQKWEDLPKTSMLNCDSWTGFAAYYSESGARCVMAHAWQTAKNGAHTLQMAVCPYYGHMVNCIVSVTADDRKNISKFFETESLMSANLG